MLFRHLHLYTSYSALPASIIRIVRAQSISQSNELIKAAGPGLPQGERAAAFFCKAAPQQAIVLSMSLMI